MGQVRKLRTSHATPAFAHAFETFLVAHTAVGAWSLGTAVGYRQFFGPRRHIQPCPAPSSTPCPLLSGGAAMGFAQ